MSTQEKNVLAQELFRAFTQFKRLGGPPSSVHGIKKSEFMLLATLINHFDSEEKGVKVSDLGAHLQITPAAVTHMINSLEKGGYIERQADPKDRRIVLIKPTEAGKQIMEQMKAEFLKKLEGLSDFLGEQDSRELVRLLSLAFTYFKERKENDGDRN